MPHNNRKRQVPPLLLFSLQLENQIKKQTRNDEKIVIWGL